jgi:hypothetical protein
MDTGCVVDILPPLGLIVGFAAGCDNKVYVAVAIALFESPGAVAIALTVVVAFKVREVVYCWVVPWPGEGVLPSVV